MHLALTSCPFYTQSRHNSLFLIFLLEFATSTWATRNQHPALKFWSNFL